MLGPGLFTFTRRFPNGNQLFDGGTLETELDLPVDGKPVRIGLYLPPAEGDWDMACWLTIGSNKERLDDRYLRAILDALIAEAGK